MTFSAWFDALSPGGKIGAAFIILLAAMGAAAGFVTSIARIARLVTRLFGGSRTRRGGPDGPGAD